MLGLSIIGFTIEGNNNIIYEVMVETNYLGVE